MTLHLVTVPADLPWPALVAGLVALMLVADLLVLLVRRRRRARGPVDEVAVDAAAEHAATEGGALEELLAAQPADRSDAESDSESDTGPEDADLAEVPDLGAEEPEDPEAVEVRTLRAQVRVLEQAVQELEQRAASVVATAGPGGSAAYRRRVQVTVRALAEASAADAAAREVLARVLAALARLDHDGSFERPALPGLDHGAAAPVTLRRVPPLPVLPSVPAAEPAVAVAEVDTVLLDVAPAEPETVEAETVEQATVEAPPAQPAPPVVRPEPEVVLPVPPPAAPEPRRGRRRQRHQAA